jgi:hypothetical protein
MSKATRNSVAISIFDGRKGSKLFRLVGETPRGRMRGAEYATEKRLKAFGIPVHAMVMSGALEAVDQDEADAMVSAAIDLMAGIIEEDDGEATVTMVDETSSEINDDAPVVIMRSTKPEQGLQKVGRPRRRIE